MRGRSLWCWRLVTAASTTPWFVPPLSSRTRSRRRRIAGRLSSSSSRPFRPFRRRLPTRSNGCFAIRARLPRRCRPSSGLRAPFPGGGSSRCTNWERVARLTCRSEGQDEWLRRRSRPGRAARSLPRDVGIFVLKAAATAAHLTRRHRGVRAASRHERRLCRRLRSTAWIGLELVTEAAAPPPRRACWPRQSLRSTTWIGLEFVAKAAMLPPPRARWPRRRRRSTTRFGHPVPRHRGRSLLIIRTACRAILYLVLRRSCLAVEDAPAHVTTASPPDRDPVDDDGRRGRKRAPRGRGRGGQRKAEDGAGNGRQRTGRGTAARSMSASCGSGCPAKRHARHARRIWMTPAHGASRAGGGRRRLRRALRPRLVRRRTGRGNAEDGAREGGGRGKGRRRTERGKAEDGAREGGARSSEERKSAGMTGGRR